MTPQTCITTARYLINDTDSVLYRQENAELLSYFNLGLKEAAKLSPDHFKTTGDFTCNANITEQAIAFSDAQEFLGVIRIKDGKALHEMDMQALSQYNPDWASDTAGTPQNWAKLNGEKLRFYLYPKPSTMQVLEVSYLRNPEEYELADSVTDVPATWETALAWYIIHMAEMKDDEHVNSGRAVAAYQRFATIITGAMPQAGG
ncbi:MAG: DUF6682 family protein [Methylophilus sp.]|jgi:hypothetical protein